MKMKPLTWAAFVLGALISLAVWSKISYPQLVIADFSIDRKEAVAIAKDYLRRGRNVDVSPYRVASIFRMDENANRFLQKTIGPRKIKAFINEHEFDMFYWIVRFFQENQKEEYLLIVDSHSGEVTEFSHIIDDNAARKTIDKNMAHKKAVAFLGTKFGFDPSQHKLRGNLATIRDNRTDYLFSWQKKNVNIAWSDEPNNGTGKLLISATVSGDEILKFSKHRLLIPDQFNRHIQKEADKERSLATMFRIIILFLICCGIYLIVARQNHLAMHSTKKFYISLLAFSLLLSLLGIFNQSQSTLYGYNTSIPLDTYLLRNTVEMVLGALFITVTFLIPGFAGELLHHETSAQQKEGSFLYYVQSTFLSRSVAGLTVLGYLVGMVLLGLQAIFIRLGQDHLGVWTEHSWVNISSTAYFPFLAALTFGFKTSVSEELMYRMFAVNLGKKVLGKFFPEKSIVKILLVGFICAFIWGFAHTSNYVFPGWFRGLEVTGLGFFMVFVYLKFGLIPVLVAHYLFDVFWSTIGYLLGPVKPVYFYGSLAALMLPLLFAIAAYLINKRVELRPLRWKLNKHQEFNLQILKNYLSENKADYMNKPEAQIRREIISHGWDPAVVEVALKSIDLS